MYNYEFFFCYHPSPPYARQLSVVHKFTSINYTSNPESYQIAKEIY